MRVRDARAVAAHWVAEHASVTPGFAGAFLNGSTAWLPADAALPVGSDVDITVVVSGEHAPDKQRKLPYDGLLVEVSYMTWAELPSAEAVLSTYYLAGAFRTQGTEETRDTQDTVLADPTGRLTGLRTAVARDFARPLRRGHCTAWTAEFRTKRSNGHPNCRNYDGNLRAGGGN